MIGKILDAVLKEVQALQAGTGGQCMLKTKFKVSEMPNYTYPLVLLSLDDAPPSTQYPGGLTRMEWMFSFNTYAYEPDAYVDDTSGYSTDLLQPIDDIRVHFERGGSIVGGIIQWLTTGMGEMLQEYGFKFTLTGVTTADAITEDGLEMGYKIGFDSTAFDTSTLFVGDSTQVLQTVKQVDNPPFNGHIEPIS